MPFAAVAALRLRPSRWSGCADVLRRRGPGGIHVSEFVAAGLCRLDWPHNWRFCAVQSAASAVQGQRPRASRSKVNILFDHASGLFKMLDHTEPIVNSHAPHSPAPHSPCTTPWTSFYTMVKTTQARVTARATQEGPGHRRGPGTGGGRAQEGPGHRRGPGTGGARTQELKGHRHRRDWAQTQAALIREREPL